MNTISQSEVLLQDATNEVGSFLRKYQVSDILKRCNGYKQKGFSVIQLFTYLVTLMFQPLSTYMSMRVGAYKELFSKNTIRRFCNIRRSWNYTRKTRRLTSLRFPRNSRNAGFFRWWADAPMWHSLPLTFPLR